MTAADLNKMTVLELRKLAKEMKVKLGAGIDKAGIIAKLVSAEDEAPSLSTEAASLSFDVTSAAVKPYHSRGSENQERVTYRPAWQNRQENRVGFRQPGFNAGPKRFGPQTSASAEKKTEEKKNLVTSDGFRLGYRASSQSANRNTRELARDHQESNNYHTRTYPAYSAENCFHDDLFRMEKNAAFDRPGNELPEQFRFNQGSPCEGYADLLPAGYGFLRRDPFSPNSDDPYLSPAMLRRFRIRPGDYVEGIAAQVRPGDPYPAVLYLNKVNNEELNVSSTRVPFEKLTAISPEKRIPLDNTGAEEGLRMADLIAPIGFGQRAIMICPPESGCLSMMKGIANAVVRADPDAKVLLLLLDEPAEDITEVKENTSAEVFASAFGETPEAQTRTCELALEIALRYAEEGKNAVLLLDSINKLTRAYQAVQCQGTRPISNTVTPLSLTKPKRFFGLARNTREAGSLTVIASILTETGSRMDEIIYEEFRGSANSTLVLCSSANSMPVFPLPDLKKSGTRREDLLLSDEEKEGMDTLHSMLDNVDNTEAAAQLVDMFGKTKNNRELLHKLREWFSLLGGK